jgi:hypothetical protein
MSSDLLLALLFIGSSAPISADAPPDAAAIADRIDSKIQRASRPCSMDALPLTEKRRMIVEYQRRRRVQGQAEADAWATEEGNRFRRQLVAEGVCPPLAEEDNRAARISKPGGKPPLMNRQGKTCRNVGVENRMIPSFDGAPMTMILVPVCKD